MEGYSLLKDYTQVSMNSRHKPKNSSTVNIFRGSLAGKYFCYFKIRGFVNGCAAASWLVLSSPDRAVRVRVLSRDIVVYSWGRHFTPTVPLHTQVYKWIPANLMLGVTLQKTCIPFKGSRNTPNSFILQNPG